jgi:hypothetical protein
MQERGGFFFFDKPRWVLFQWAMLNIRKLLQKKSKNCIVNYLKNKLKLLTPTFTEIMGGLLYKLLFFILKNNNF